MKKIMHLGLLVCLLFALVSCGGDSDAPPYVAPAETPPDMPYDYSATLIFHNTLGFTVDALRTRGYDPTQADGDNWSPKVNTTPIRDGESYTLYGVRCAVDGFPALPGGLLQDFQVEGAEVDGDTTTDWTIWSHGILMVCGQTEEIYFYNAS